MDKFDKYYISKHLNIRSDLKYSYVKYDEKTLLISNGYGVVYTKSIRNDFKENDKLKSALIRFYDYFMSKASECNKRNIALSELKDGLVDGHYKINKDFSVDYTQLKKIIDIIGVRSINFIEDDAPIIEIVGRDNQVGYLLPCRVY
jgi:hypothetical protein